jgi:hypothetical protein
MIGDSWEDRAAKAVFGFVLHAALATLGGLILGFIINFATAYIAQGGGWPRLNQAPRVPLDKSEGGVKDKSILPVFLAPRFCQRGLRTKTLEISR